MKSKTSLGFHLSVLLSSCILNERNEFYILYERTVTSMMNTQAVVHIRKGEARSLKAGGMWIYDNEIE